MPQFNRVCRLTVGQPGGDGVIIENLKITFDIDKDLTDRTNKSRVKIYNLAPATRTQIERMDSICILEAGYAQDVGLKRIFAGAILQSWTTNEGPDAITELVLSDGQVAVRDSVLSVGYGAGTNGAHIAADIALQMGLLLNVGPGVSFIDYPNGYSFVGYGKDALTEICTASNVTWSIQNNAIQIIDDNGTNGTMAFVFSPDSGLIGSPERIVKSPKHPCKPPSTTTKKGKPRKARKTRQDKKAGWRIKTLLCPTVSPGDLARVDSQTVTGWFKVETLKHKGDTYGNEWNSYIDLIEVQKDASGNAVEVVVEGEEDEQ